MERGNLTNVLLDTHVLVWLLDGNNRLGPSSRMLIKKAAQSDFLFISVITIWEIAMLVSKGRLIFKKDVGEWLQTAVSLPGLSVEPLSLEIAVASTRLLGEINPDPADRIIVATARHLGALLITEDTNLLYYGQQGHITSKQASL